MAKQKGIDSLSASNTLFGERTQGGTTGHELTPAKDGPTPAPAFRNTDLPNGHVHPPKKVRERRTTRSR